MFVCDTVYSKWFWLELFLKVIVGSDTEQKLDFVRPSGVLATVLYTDENLVKNVLRHTNNLGVDIVFDTVGGSCFHQALDWY